VILTERSKLRPMRWELVRVGLAAVTAMAAASCDRLAQPAGEATPAPAAAPAAPFDSAMVRAQTGKTYSTFVGEAPGVGYAPEALGIVASDRARLWRGMATPTGGILFTGGGAEALVFRGCAETSCADGASIVAIDTANGGVFAAVRDVGGADVLAPNDRIEALLRLNSPTQSWEDAIPSAAPPLEQP
jgi:hypothetical protein